MGYGYSCGGYGYGGYGGSCGGCGYGGSGFINRFIYPSNHHRS